ncbi:MAG: hypothetical protein NVSMB47_19980 [Polyangiales bacterium]
MRLDFVSLRARQCSIRAGIAAALGLLAGCAHHETPREHALLRVARGDLRGGTVELEAVRDGHPRDARAWIDLGHAYELGHRYDDALAAYDRAAAVQPLEPDGPREGGMRTAAWGEYAAARPRLEAAIARGDREASTYHALGLVRLQLGDRAGAREAYLRGLAQPDGARDATCVLGLATLAVLAEDAGQALRWYDELAARRPSSSGAQLGRAWALAGLGRFDEALAAIDAAASLGGRPADLTRLRDHVAAARANAKR